ncbi:MAG TPA: TonB-dependent receptor [Gemmatimonadales bacterium]
MSPTYRVLATALGLCSGLIGPLAAQTTGQIVGEVLLATDSTPLAQVEVLIPGTRWRAVTGANGGFVLLGVPPGSYRVVARRLGYQSAEWPDVSVRSGVSTRLAIVLQQAAIGVEPIRVVAPSQPLLTPDVTAARQVVSRDELQSAPIEDIQQILELRTGVTDGHFRGGRFGQETYVIDGVDVRDQFSASRSGIAFQLAPSAIQEISVFTSGFSADQASAVSGVVTFVTRSGPPDRWTGRLEAVTDEWAPASLKRGYVRGGASLGGPLVGGATAFFDLSLFGQADQDPRIMGLTCLSALTPCPAQRTIIPHQEGDRYFAFGKIDVPISGSFSAAISLSRNRDQHELYSTRFKYALRDYLAERETATLGTVSLTGNFRISGSRAVRLTSRMSVARLDRYLGVPDTIQSGRVGRFRVNDLKFRGEEFTHLPAEDQIGSGRNVPGYQQPSDSGLASPYGIFGADLFVTDGTAGVAEWSRSDFVDLGLDLQTLVSPVHDLKIGGDLKMHRIATYQHVAAGLAGAAPNFVRFYPRTAAVYFHNTLHALDAATIDLGVRVEAFQPRLIAPTDRRNLSAPTASTEWQALIHPRVGFAMPLSILGIDRAAVRWNFGRFAQPPDFQFFFDQALDDSLNTAVRRQGNPNLGFERAIQYEAALDYLLTGDVVLRLTGYLKDLTGITTSGIAVADRGRTFSNLDFGKVQGMEVRLEARLDDGRRFELGYAMQRAVGIVSSAFDSTVEGVTNLEELELPLQFDQRHAVDINAFWTLPAEFRIALGGSVGSGLPVPGAAERRLPWSAAISARLSRQIRWGPRVMRLMIEGRNLLNRANLVTARANGGIEPNVAALQNQATAETQGAVPIPRESPLYVPGFDQNDNGFLDPSEQTAARRAALLDANEPTLFYGEARQIRIGFSLLF